MRDSFEEQLQRLYARVEPLGAVFDVLQKTLDKPLFDQENNRFYFKNPGYKHFCLLMSARIISGLRAGLAIVELGFTQEAMVLLRVVNECCTKTDFILGSSNINYVESENIQKFLEIYFSDPKKKKRDFRSLSDKVVGDLESFAGNNIPELKDRIYEAYGIFSGFVHSDYYHIMDMVGGRDRKFHINGMRMTPKDRENIDVYSIFIKTGELVHAHIASKCEIINEIMNIESTRDWYLSQVGLS